MSESVNSQNTQAQNLFYREWIPCNSKVESSTTNIAPYSPIQDASLKLRSALMKAVQVSLERLVLRSSLFSESHADEYSCSVYRWLDILELEHTILGCLELPSCSCPRMDSTRPNDEGIPTIKRLPYFATGSQCQGHFCHHKSFEVKNFPACICPCLHLLHLSTLIFSCKSLDLMSSHVQHILPPPFLSACVPTQ
jgi:hypothetical protein